MSIRIVLADDHRMFREALRAPLASEADIEIVGEAGTGREAIDAVERLRPDVLVLDIAMPDMNGVEVARALGASRPEVRILALSGYADRRFVEEMLKSGARGYVAKSAAGNELVRAIRAVTDGRSYLSPEAAETIVQGMRRPGGAPPAPDALGRRERQVLALVAEGRRTPYIAAKLGISAATVEVHRRNLMRKLGLHNVADLTKYAIREGIASL